MAQILMEKGDLFDSIFLKSVDCVVHCISSDLALGAGIAKTFIEKYPTLRKTIDNPSEFDIKVSGKHFRYTRLQGFNGLPNIHLVHLITKEKYYQKPTLFSLRTALEEFRDEYISELVEWSKSNRYILLEIGMPLIGCGLDKLKWDEVHKLLEDVFSDFETVIIRVRYLKESDIK